MSERMRQYGGLAELERPEPVNTEAIKPQEPIAPHPEVPVEVLPEGTWSKVEEPKGPLRAIDLVL